MKPFLGDDFLLNCEAARRLYHDYAAEMPIFDYHCHVPVADMAENRQFDNLTQIWLAGDHYKWRAMRACGVPERCITGDATDREKFDAWAATMPQVLCNPLYHWSHLELRRYFGITELLNPHTADCVWDAANAVLHSEKGRVRNLIASSNVRLLCTTDDPTDDLSQHAVLAACEASWGVRVLPAFRPDAAFGVHDATRWNAWVDTLQRAAGLPIASWAQLLAALEQRHELFHKHGCRTSDYGLELPFADDWTEAQASAAFDKVRAGTSLRGEERGRFCSALLFSLLSMHGRAGWVQQLHMGALRNTNSRMMRQLGADTGFDCMGDASPGRPLVRLFDQLDSAGMLAKTIVYSLNPRDNAMLASIIGSFQDGSVPGKMQFGSAWWFNDQKEGMERQLEALGSVGILSLFVGMLTDSRSFLSYPRHEYFRRLLCEKIGQEMERGELPPDFALTGAMVRDICYFNAVRYFAMGPKSAV